MSTRGANEPKSIVPVVLVFLKIPMKLAPAPTRSSLPSPSISLAITPKIGAVNETGAANEPAVMEPVELIFL